jgi:hypothetical protein
MHQFLTKIEYIARLTFVTASEIGGRFQPFERKTVSTIKNVTKNIIAIFLLLGHKPITSIRKLAAFSDK